VIERSTPSRSTVSTKLSQSSGLKRSARILFCRIDWRSSSFETPGIVLPDLRNASVCFAVSRASALNTAYPAFWRSQRTLRILFSFVALTRASSVRPVCVSFTSLARSHALIAVHVQTTPMAAIPTRMIVAAVLD
jgi:hypothetical protein